jgi:hypothetical protein
VDVGVVLIVLAAGAPWLVGIAYYWKKMPRGEDPPSFGEHLRRLVDR